MPPLPTRDPAAAAVRRLTHTLVIDPAVVRGLARGEAWAALGWAAGLAPFESDDVGPAAAAAALQRAVGAADADADAALWFGCGLALTGGLGRRRGMPPEALRAFEEAARLAPGQALAHLAVAGAALSQGDRRRADRALRAAAEADAADVFPSPLAAELLAESPWLAREMALFWPGHVMELLRYTVDLAARPARGRARSALLPPLEGAARRVAALAADQPPGLTAAGVLLSRVWAWRAVTEPALVEPQQQVAEALLAAAAARRALTASFEVALRRELQAAGLGVTGGLGVAGWGGLRHGRRPPPGLLAWSGRWLVVAGAATAAVAVASVAIPNPVARAARRRAERRVLTAEAVHSAEVAAAWRSLLAAVPPIDSAPGDG